MFQAFLRSENYLHNKLKVFVSKRSYFKLFSVLGLDHSFF